MADVKIDSGGIEAVLKSAQVASAVHGLAEQIAGTVRGQRPEADVAVDDYETDRAASSVTIREAYGRRLQARDGTLTRAAAQAGLEVTGRDDAGRYKRGT